MRGLLLILCFLFVSLPGFSQQSSPQNEQDWQDLFCRTWEIVDSIYMRDIGLLWHIAKDGTYFFATSYGRQSQMFKWRPADEMGDFEYSHDNWVHHGRARVIDLSRDRLEIIHLGFGNRWKLVPVNY
jgi:hypothetical protein